MGTRRRAVISETTIGLTLMALLAAGLSNCSSPTIPDSMTFTSSNVNSHTHNVTLSQGELKESEGNIVKTTT